MYLLSWAYLYFQIDRGMANSPSLNSSNGKIFWTKPARMNVNVIQVQM